MTVALFAPPAACVPPDTMESPEPPAAMPERYSAGDEKEAEPEPKGEAAERGAKRPAGRWWKTLGDPQLEALVQRAVGGSYDLDAAYARIAQAEARTTQANARRWPQVNAQGQVQYAQQPSSFTESTLNASASLPVSYEVDLFGEHKAASDAAELEASATRHAFEAAAMSLAANVAETWYDLVEARASRTLTEEQLELNETYLELVKLRFKQGLVSALDVHQQRQQVITTRSQLSLIDGQREALRQQLALLVGGTPGRLEVGSRDTLPELPPPPDGGVPADLLTQRPDVRAAQLQVAAADHRVGSAIASRLPKLTLTGTPSYTYQRSELNPAFTMPGESNVQTEQGFGWSVGALLDVPLFDGFARRAQTELNRAQVREALASYQQTVNQATLEVQTALAQEREQRKHIEDLETEVEVAEDTLQAARDRYRQGLTDFLPVLTALRAKQQSELSLLQARRLLLSYRIQLHRALGGTWTHDLDEPTPVEGG
ncbi:MAG: TolC family protein [Polyangiales bacterium]